MSEVTRTSPTEGADQPAEPALELIISGPRGVRRHAARGLVTIGRDVTASIRLEDDRISRVHLAVHCGLESFVEDLGSRNGTRISGALLRPGERRLLLAGDVMVIGAHSISMQRVFAPVAEVLAEVDASPAVVPPQSASMREIWQALERASQSNLHVLLLGETGVGKDVCARRLHRGKGPFMAINCAAISEQLMESELFGHERGAFTGATSSKRGLLESANGGTCFLDEVGELTLSVQAKLLHVLERGEVLRVGAVRPSPITVRFVAATNRELANEVKAKRFREDLYFRLAAITLTVPPLRKRGEDVLVLARSFVTRACAAQQLPERPLTAAGEAALLAYSWPGNVRELKNVIERALAMTRGPSLEVADLQLPAKLSLPLDTQLASDELTPEQRVERQRILDALAATAGNQSHAAEQLGISRSTLVARIKLYSLPRPRK